MIMNIYKEIKEKNNKVKLYNDIKFKLIIIPNEEKKRKCHTIFVILR